MVASGIWWPRGGGTVSRGGGSGPHCATPRVRPKGSTVPFSAPGLGGSGGEQVSPGTCWRRGHGRGHASEGGCGTAVLGGDSLGLAGRGPTPWVRPHGGGSCDAVGHPRTSPTVGESIPGAGIPSRTPKSSKAEMGGLQFSPSPVSPLGWPRAPAWAVAYRGGDDSDPPPTPPKLYFHIVFIKRQ